MIRRIIRWLASSAVTDLVLNLHYLPDSITAVVGDGSDLDVRVRYSWEQPRILGSAGGPRLARDIVGAETFFIVNGDTLTDLDLGPMADAHARVGRARDARARAESTTGAVRRRPRRPRRSRQRLRAARIRGAVASLHRRADRAGRGAAIAHTGHAGAIDRRPLRRADSARPWAPSSGIVCDAGSGTWARRPTTGRRPRHSPLRTERPETTAAVTRPHQPIGPRHAIDPVGRCRGGRGRDAGRMHRDGRRRRAGGRRHHRAMLVRPGAANRLMVSSTGPDPSPGSWSV